MPLWRDWIAGMPLVRRSIDALLRSAPTFGGAEQPQRRRAQVIFRLAPQGL